MLLFLSVLKAFSEVLALSLLGQGILYLVAGRSREQNFVYRMFSAVTRPVMRIARFIMPRFVLDRHIWLVAVLLVFVVWVVAGQQKLRLCMTQASDSPLCVELVKALKERRGETK
ncbi:MAG: hypothetical protein IT531_24090 [Burkholderiales bacterium]|nr:hypothetical protein [Burkholderiales bacterium]